MENQINVVNSIMKKTYRHLNYMLILATILISSSCKTITVPVICTSKVTIPNAYIESREILPLAKDNDTTHNDLDTFYLKKEKQTGKLYEVRDEENIKDYINHPEFSLEKYVYLKGVNQTEVTWKNTVLQYLINDTAYPVEVVCSKHLTTESMNLIQESLKAEGYITEISQNPNYETDIQTALIKFQKDNNLAYGKLDLVSLGKLGITVRVDSKLEQSQ
jgi:hypothetical protein